jgi:hypothetical protein
MGYSSSFLRINLNTVKNKSQSKPSYSKFNYLTLLAIALCLGSVAGVNLIIDPYGIFATPVIKKFNVIKPEKENSDRLYKAFDIRRIKPTTIFLGSSRVATGLNSNHPAFSNPELTYNSGFQAGNTYEILRYLEHAIAQQPELERVILGIDFFMFNSNLANRQTFSEDRLGTKFPYKDILNATLSLDTLVASKDTLKANITPNYKSDRLNKTIDRFKFWLSGFLSNDELYKTYSLSQERLDNLQAIVTLCQQHDIELKIFISPTHATQYEAIAAANLWSTFELWKREITKITPVWDFSGYNSITTEPIGDRMIYYIDNSHYSQTTGDLVIDRLLSWQTESLPKDFGVYLTSETVESHLNKIRSERKLWQDNNPQEVRLVKEIEQKLTK